MFSLGLVSAANIDAVCGDEYEMDNVFEFNPYEIAQSVFDLSGTLKKLIYSYHSKEFKIDNKESICAYMNVYDLSFLNTQLTQDDIEQFERYMAEKGEYDEYEKYKEFYIRTLKFFKYYRNQIPSYKTKDLIYTNNMGAVILDLQKYNGKIELSRYVYGKVQGGFLVDYSFDKFKKQVARETTCSEATANSKEELVECAKNKKILLPILKWAESNMKQKGGQK